MIYKGLEAKELGFDDERNFTWLKHIAQIIRMEKH